MPTPTAGPSRTQPRRASTPPSSDPDTATHTLSATRAAQMTKDLVRLALATEYTRAPLRRADISSKVLGSTPRAFRRVFDDAQLALRTTFGMELVELPSRERTQLAERRKAQAARSQKGGASQATQGGSSSSKSWILVSTLPRKFHEPGILPPSRAPTAEAEAVYVGLYSFVVALILISGGALAEAKLERHLKRVNADTSTPVDRTDKLLARMIKEGYVYKVKDTSSGDELVEFMVGPRGRVEVGEEGVAGLVRRVYGEGSEELEKRIERSLRLSGPVVPVLARNGGGEGSAPKRKRQAGVRAGAQGEESEEEDA